MTEETLEGLPNVAVFTGDSAGHIHVLNTRSKNYNRVAFAGASYGAGLACQLLAYGDLQLPNSTSHSILAIARKNADIDIVIPQNAEDANEIIEKDQDVANVLCTINESRMRVGAERWVGLRITKEGVISCTSGGAFRFTRLKDLELDFDDLKKRDKKAPALKLTKEDLEKISIEWSVTGPLHQVVFYPDTGKPRLFAYGGEHVALSIWDYDKTLEQHSLENRPKNHDSARDSNREENHATGQKRRSPSKKAGSNLLMGEVWRAKSLPNTALSLPQYPLIRSITFFPLKNTSAQKNEGSHNLFDAAVAVGTKDGLVRVYHPTGSSSKHISQWQVVPKKQGAIRVLQYSQELDMFFVGDTSKNLYAVDAKTGHLSYQYKDITGSISSLLLLRLELQSQVSTYLLGSSLDRLIRLFDVGKIYGKNQRRRGKELASYFTGVDNVTSMVCKSVETSSPAKDSDDKDEDIWAGMALADDQHKNEVENNESKGEERHSKKPRLKAH
ncbi:hypothetical protein MPSI1_000019 [Malassezia psittaci]|uniref:Ribosome biogenesis protein NSA1 n=1 Tax=Malassezia psittaci TaxID=1821823 RepID=A0AAF0FAQ0_9BASI|nr:hypothetical protein MPSI1_000019 [Malassezia psittaci]